MKGYKGFGPGLICKDKQYQENTVFEEPEAKIYEKGMHFCENPFDVLDYYDLIRSDGTPNEFAEVEALDEPKTDDKKKFCSRINIRERGVAGEQNFRAGEQNFQSTINNNKINNNPPTPQGCGVVEDGGFYKAGRFEGFWKFYKSVVPKGRPVGDKQRAVKAWCRQKPTDADIAAMGAALITASKQDDWRRGVGIPHAATWLNQRRWESAPETGTAGAEDERAQTEVARW